MINPAIVALIAANFAESFTSSIIRVTISYRVLEIGLSSAWLGWITAIYAILPVAIALQAGRYVDRGNDARLGWIGGGLLLGGAVILAEFHDITALFLGSALIGASGVIIAIGSQAMVARFAAPGKLDNLIGTYLLTGVLGQAFGPIFIGWVGGSAKIPPTDFLFNVGMAASVVTCAGLLLLRPSRDTPHHASSSKPIPIRDIFKIPGMTSAIVVGTVTVAAQDLIVVYLPLIGVERGLPVSDVGMLLAIRSIASMAIRVVYAPVKRYLGSSLLLKLSTFFSAAGYFAVAWPLPFPALVVVIALLGGALGLSMTVSIGRAISISPPNIRGTANSLRMMGNRAGMVVVPSVAGVLAAAAGVAAIFVVIGAGLAVIWGIVLATDKPPKDG